MNDRELSIKIGLFWINVVQACLYLIAAVFVGTYVAGNAWITGAFLSAVFIVIAYSYAREPSAVDKA